MATRSRVTVLGGGVVGLTAAVVLAEHGHLVRVVTSGLPTFGEGSRSICTEGACALWLPIFVDCEINVLSRLCSDSLQRYSQLGPKEGVVLTSNVELLSRSDIGHATVAVARGLLGGDIRELNYPITIQNSDGTCPRLELAWECDTYVIEMPKYVGWLREYAERVGVTFTFEAIRTLDDIIRLSSDVVVNCLGLQAGLIFNDGNMGPKKGHLIRLPHQAASVAIGAGEYCLIPRRDALIAGSLTIDTHDPRPLPSDRARIISNLSALAPIALSYGYNIDTIPFELGSDITALRPYRKGGPRIETEMLGDRVRLIHNYGHGGSGVTLAWGCANIVASLVSSASGGDQVGR